MNPGKKRITPTLVVVGVCLVYILGVFILNEGDPLSFVLLGTRFAQGDPQGTEGYDGQFAYQIATNPFGAAPYLDVPPYRYQRILYPLLARLLAFGQIALIPYALILVNLIAIGVGTWATERLLKDCRVSRWYALVYGLYGSQLLGLRASLNEPLAQGLVQLAMLAWARDKRFWTIVVFSLAILAKETALIFLAAYILDALSQRQWRWAAGVATAALPFAVYQLLLSSQFGRFGVGSGGAGATSFSLIPLGGWLSIAGVSLPAFFIISLIVVPMSILPAIAVPTAIGNPCPRAPVFCSTPFTLRVGWPIKWDWYWFNVSNSESG